MIKGIYPCISCHKVKYSYLTVILILFFTLGAGNTAVAESPARRTADMISALENLERHDAVFPEFTSLLEEIFSKKKPHRRSASNISRFLLTETSNPGKRYLISEIAGTGQKSAIDYLGRLLTYEQTADLALNAMETLPDPHADKVLKDFFPRVPAKTRVGIINALGRRRSRGTYDFLLRSISDPDPAVSRAVVASLGKMGEDRAAPVLNAAMRSASIPNESELMDALMIAAEKFESEGKKARAFEIYSSILEITPPGTASVAAVRGMIRTTSGRPEDVLAARLESSPPDLRVKLIGLARELPAEYDQAYQLFKVPGLTDDDRIRLLTALAERNDPNIHDEAVRFLHHENPRFREAAIFTMFSLATSGDILLLAELASSAGGREQELLREVIYRIPGQEADEVILTRAREISGPTGVELIMAIRERHIQNGSAILLETAASNDPDIRMESYRSLGRIAGSRDIDRLAGLLTQTAVTRERQELERAIYLAAIREGISGSRDITALLDIPMNERDRASLISVLGNIKNPDDLHVLLGYLDQGNEEIRLSAIRALSDWPDAGPAPKFKELMATSDDPRVKVLTLRGFTRIILNDGNIGNDKKAGELMYGLTVAPNDAEKRLIISGLGNIHSPVALTILADQMEHPELRREVEAAILNLVPRLIERHPGETRKELERVLKFSDNQELLKWAKE
jgi:HEAT repeat protein